MSKKTLEILVTQKEQIPKVNTHLGIEQSRRDDLEAVGYATWPHELGQISWPYLFFWP
jgi:hypothetical protein